MEKNNVKLDEQTRKIILADQKKQVDKLLSFIHAECLDNEVWREIPGQHEKFFVSNQGRILSIYNNEPRLLKQFICGGYYYVSLSGRDYRVNRIVAQAFLPNPENKPIVHHLDSNKLNNAVDNLAWATHKENTLAYWNSKAAQELEEQ